MQKRAKLVRVIGGLILSISALLIASIGSNDAFDSDDGHRSCDATNVRIDAAMDFGPKPYPVRRRCLNGQSDGFSYSL